MKKKFINKKGLAPGNLEFHGEIVSENSLVEFIEFSTHKFNRHVSSNIEEISSKIDLNNQNWLSFVGLHNVDYLKIIGEKFKIHRLHLEDILNTDHRPKFEKQNNYLFFVAKLFSKTDDTTSNYEQISIIIGNSFVLTFQEKESDVFKIIKTDLERNDSKVRNSKCDYLFYRIIDSIVDSFYYSLEKVSSDIEILENQIHDDPKSENHKQIQELKRELILLRKSAYPLREAISKLQKESSELISQDTSTYIGDVYDHCVQVLDGIETYRDLTSSLMDLYMTSMSNKMNEVMKVLTIISTIFIPITFIAGVYGMNFEYMPELTLKWGYPITVLVMILLAVGMLFYFKKKKWF